MPDSTIATVYGLSVRPATNHDRERVLALVTSALAEFGLNPDLSTSENDLRDIEGTYWKAGGMFSVLEDRDGTMLGTVAVAPISQTTCKLRKMYLAPGARGRGLGRALLNHAIGFARDRGYREIRLETVSAMKAAIRLYRKAGFRPVGGSAVSPRCDRVFSLNIA